MATVESWTGTIADMGPIYPWASDGGTETVMWIVGLVFWLAWMIWQSKHETKVYAEEVKRFGDRARE